MKNRISGRRAAVVASLLLAGAASAKPLVWWTMANDAANGGSNIVATTTFTNCASAANEFYGKIGKGSKFPNNFLLPVPTNGFEHPFLLQDGVFGVPAENAFAIDIPSDPDRPGDNLWGASLSPYDPEGKLNCPSFTIEFFFRTKKWTNWHGLIVKPYYDGEGENTNTIAIREVSYSQTNQRFRIWGMDALRRVHRVGNLSPAEAAESAEGGFGQSEPPRPSGRV